MVFFLVFYTAYEVNVGVGTGFLVDYANGLRAAELQDYNGNAILADADPVSVSLVLGFFGWVVAMLAAAVAIRRAGAGCPATLLLAGAALFAIHPPPIGPIGLACFAGAAVLIERWRSRDAGTAAVPSETGLAPST